MDENDRIRERAYRIWIEEGRPPGRSDEHWQMARQLIAIEQSDGDELKPNPLGQEQPVEEARLQENLGEFPTLTDQGEEATTPKARRAPGVKAKELTGDKAQPEAVKRRQPSSRTSKLVDMLTSRR